MAEFGELLSRAKLGDSAALAAVHERYAPVVRARIHSRFDRTLRRRYDTADLAQSVFLEVLRDIPEFEDRGEPAFRHWLCIKAESKVLEKIRKERGRGGSRRRETGLSTGAGDAVPARRPGPGTDAGAGEDHDRVRRLVDELDAAAREIVDLRTIQGLAFDEIARRLSLDTADAARKRYARAILRLRDKWQSP